ncbi:16S rRNA (adenine(1518)-N(6)/adenine(1519)-N(6))-dimethyltransferase RsmA [Hydromonas duriensis]|uniref:Ribosomal RNA small subunit methyltransferase A n=1 Tax=Hydromonas duriensis TaxID=1527608 RepID=A0A4R6Y979_9BURK|nr:16S rRNA (adenine(1518)-N(6)/adenine(1519)-N(6))-dimethyltransferase RsmA [Hydromonas duriensis]TDR32002.1 16S rRNA (adenine1518-N6/adenine1519-N6)-dimethyltransferase [Hydromonas duriensis]
MSTHIARKRFGQNFLHDDGVIADIVRAIDPQASDCLTEIGPGLAALTAPLLEYMPHMHAVELDRDLVTRLQQRFKPSQLTIHSTDALNFDFLSIPAAETAQRKVVGNLPYNISSPLLFHLVEFAPHIDMQVFMLQKEVIERMVASPSDKAYGRLSVMLQYRYEMEHLFDVPPHAFTPAPKVTSAIVRMYPKPVSARHATDENHLSKLVAQAFSQRRKMLRNTLGDMVSLDQMAACDIKPTARAEELSLEQFVQLSNFLLAHPDH